MPSVQSWLAIAEQDPARVVAVLRLDEANPMTEDGDIATEIRTVLQAVLIVARDLNLKTPRYTKLWGSLAKAGIADALCACIADPNLLANSSEATETPVPSGPTTSSSPPRPPLSPWAPALHALTYGTVAMKQPPSAIDKILIAALKKHWSKIVSRLWNDPAHSLDKDPIRANERAGIAEILKTLLRTDPSILTDCVYQPDDLTLPLIARQWQHSNSTRDTNMTSDGLMQPLVPNLVPEVKEYIKAHPPPPKRQLSERILSVFQPASGPDEAIACAALLTVAASHMARRDPLGSKNSVVELVMVLGMDRAPEDPKSKIFHTVLRSHSTFWRAFFDLYTRAGEPGKEKLIIMMLMQEHLWNVSLHERSPKQQDSQVGQNELYRTWVREGYFEAVEASLPYVLEKVPEAAKKYAIILQGMIIYVENNPAAADLRTEMATHFPRAKTMFAMHRRDIAEHHKRGLFRKFETRTNGQLEPYTKDEAGWMHTLWQQQAELEYLCKGRNLCYLRGCGNSANAKCARCQSVSYCSQICQKKDWKEHKPNCGWQYVFNQTVDKAQESKALSAELGITPLQLRQLAERMQNEDAPRLTS